MVRALEQWSVGGVPERSEGWLVRVAGNIAIDVMRREARSVELPTIDSAASTTELLDDQLSLMFLCCHPTLGRSSQIALTLKIACGFTTQQIALAFLTVEATLAQRIVRAKQQLRRSGARFEVPADDEIPTRLEPLLDVLYLVFNEGHAPSDGDTAIKTELCDEALRLARMLSELSPAASALCALFCFQMSRTRSRIADDGSLLLLQEQDRTRWDRDQISDGFIYLDRAARGAELSRFHIEAGIAACHASASGYLSTDWPQIVALYDMLRARAPSPVVDVNRAIAVAMATGALAGIDELDAIPERELITRYPYALAAYAELHASLGELAVARTYLDQALANQPSRVQRALLERKRAALER